MLSKAELHKLFNAFNGLKVMIIGDVMVDSYIWGSVKRLSPEAPVPIVNVVKRENRFGGAANVAINIQSLGAVPIMCTVIGEDEKGDTFLKILNEKNMPATGIVRSTERPTTVKFRIIGNNAHLLRVDEEADNILTESESAALYTRIDNLIQQGSIDVIIFEDYDKGVISPQLIEKVMLLAHQKSIPVVVDPKKNNFLAYKGVDLFKPNFRELCDGLKAELSFNDMPNLIKTLTAFQKEQGIATILLSLSENGVLVSEITGNNYQTFHIPAHLRSIADVSGAGDTLISVAALGIALKLDAFSMASLANLAGGVVCEYVGVVPVDKNRLFDEACKLLIED